MSRVSRTEVERSRCEAQAENDEATVAETRARTCHARSKSVRASCMRSFSTLGDVVDAGHWRCHESPTTAVSTGADRDAMPADDASPLRLRIEFSCVETGATAWC